MVKTEFAQTNLLEQQEKKESIFNHYSIENEVDFLRKIDNLPLEEREFYVRENMLAFLGEYIGQVPYKKIAYFLKENEPFFAGFPVLENYRKTAQVAGIGSREWFEYLGFDQVMHLLQDTNINSATIISPSKIADYGFVFHFVKDYSSDLVNEYILRFSEKKGELRESRRISEKLSLEKTDQVYQRLEDFLAKPLLAFSSNKRGDLERLLGIMGIEDDKIDFSNRFEQAILQDASISSWLKTYFKEISLLAETPSDNPNYQVRLEGLKFILAAIYNRAKDLKRDLSGDQKAIAIDELRMLMNLPDGISHWRTIPQSATFDMNYYALKEEPTVPVGGGNCPATKVNDVLEGLLEGKTIEQIISKEGIENPSVSEKKIKCPECGWEPTREQMEEIGKTIMRCPGVHPDGKPCRWDPCTKSRH